MNMILGKRVCGSPLQDDPYRCLLPNWCPTAVGTNQCVEAVVVLHVNYRSFVTLKYNIVSLAYPTYHD